MGAFNTALSGLQAANSDLQVLGNNISNANTVGFKSSNAEFADAYASAMANTAPTGGQVGIGTTVQTIAQQFTQGNIQTTSNPLDVAINGNGFFQFNYNGSTVYGRNGQFQINKNGVIVDANGGELIGIQAQNGKLTGASGPLTINQNAIAPQATSGLSLGLNLDSTNTLIGSGTPFSISDPTSYNYSTTTTVYDSLGTPQLVTTYYRLTSASPTSGQTWDVYYSATGTASGTASSGSVVSGTLQFNSTGQVQPPSSGSISLHWADGANPSNLSVTYSGSTNYNSPNSVITNNSNGYSAGQLSGLSIDSSGNIFGRYSNGESQLMGQISLTRFPDNNGLQNLGNNYWAETYVSGQPLSGQPGSSNLGVLQAGAVEQSNVNISKDLVNLIVAQQAYQANAQTIKTQNTVVQTLLSL